MTAPQLITLIFPILGAILAFVFFYWLITKSKEEASRIKHKKKHI